MLMNEDGSVVWVPLERHRGPGIVTSIQQDPAINEHMAHLLRNPTYYRAMPDDLPDRLGGAGIRIDSIIRRILPRTTIVGVVVQDPTYGEVTVEHEGKTIGLSA